MEDTADDTLPDSLSGLVLKYDLYKRIASKKSTTGWMFDSAHNAGNDAVANPKAFLCVITDSVFGTYSYSYDDYDNPEGYMADVIVDDIDINLEERVENAGS